jgi:Methyltransferase domain
MKTLITRPITGSIKADRSAISHGDGKGTTISWETNDPCGAELRVVIAKEEKKLVAKGHRGSVQLSWVTGSHSFRFELYSVSQPERCLACTDVPKDDYSLEADISQLASIAKAHGINVPQLARFIAKAAPLCVRSTRYPEFFRLWEQSGVHVSPVHFYQPTPDTRTLSEGLWNRKSDLPGVEMNDAVQLNLLRTCFPRFRQEYEKFPTTSDDSDQVSLTNGRFDGTDALVGYCMVRHFKPRTIIEVGSGYSSLICGRAAAMNGDSALVCIEPFPLDFLLQGFPGFRSLIQKNVQDVEIEFFSQLDSGDILFLDSSHTVKIGGDVNYLFLEVLPRLKPGVIVHVHDIFFPFDYPRDWVLNECRFWAEQYLLQAFLAFNSDFEVLLCNSYLAHSYLEEFKATFSHSPWWGGGSFWMRRRLIRRIGSTLSHKHASSGVAGENDKKPVL